MMVIKLRSPQCILMNCFFNRLLLAVLLLSACTTKLYSQAIQCGWKQLPVHPPNPVAGNKFFAKPVTILKPLGITGTNDTLYTLPVAVHVIHTGGAPGTADNPSDSQINAMLDGLNKAWRKNGLLYGGVDMKIQFELAKRSPSCNSSSGINRFNGSSIPNYANGGITNYNVSGSVPEEAVKRISRWPNTDYINIWIVNKINGSSVFPGGYAYFPEYNSAITDGIVLLASVVDGSNKTIAHEMGHYFSLYHTFYDDGYETACSLNNNCTTQGDRVCDTEPCLVKYDCSNGNNTCTGQPYIVTDIPHSYTVLNNYMGYTDCQWMFTPDQKDRARAALLTFRHGLISSGAFNSPPVSAPVAACLPTSVHGLSPYYGVEKFEFNTLQVYSNTSGADSSIYIDRSCNQSTTVWKGGSYPLTVTGSYLNPHRIKVFIDYNNNGSFNDAGEMVLSGYDGQVSGIVTIPGTNLPLRIPLRLRVVADNPALPEPGPCNISGTVAEGAGQVEDYGLVIVPKQIYSVGSGAWNTPATWSCNCVPGNDDEVVIKSAHAVTLSGTVAQCGKLSLEPGSSFTGSKNLTVINQ